MPHYLLSVHSSPDAASRPDPAPPTPDQMDAWFAQVQQLEADMEADGAWVFSGHLTGPDSATVVRDDAGRTVVTDGPFAESKEHIAGFYVIAADDLDDALQWADRVTECIGMPIEVRAFEATGHVQRPGPTTA